MTGLMEGGGGEEELDVSDRRGLHNTAVGPDRELSPVPSALPSALYGPLTRVGAAAGAGVSPDASSRRARAVSQKPGHTGSLVLAHQTNRGAGGRLHLYMTVHVPDRLPVSTFDCRKRGSLRWRETNHF